MIVRTALLVALVALSGLAITVQGQDAPAAGFAFDDPAGDAKLDLLVTQGPNMGVTPWTNTLDIVHFKLISEDELNLRFGLEVDELLYDESMMGFRMGHSVYYSLEFGLSGSALQYTIDVELIGSQVSGKTESVFVAHWVDAQMALHTDQMCCKRQPVDASMDDATNLITITVPKASLLGIVPMGGRQLDIALPTTLGPGDSLSGFVVYSAQNAGLVFFGLSEFVDRAPDTGEGPSYALTKPTANAIVALHLGENDLIPIQPNLNQTVTFQVENKAAGKRILQMSYAAVGAEGSPASGYSVKGPPTVSVPGGETRNFTFNVISPAELGITRLTIRGTIVGHPDELGYADARVVRAAPLSPSSNKLYIHQYQMEMGPVDDAFCEVFFGSCTWGYLSPDVADPNSGTKNIGAYQNFDSGGMTAAFHIGSAGTPTPVSLDADKPVSATLKFAATVAENARIIGSLFAYTDDEVVQLWSAETTGPMSGTVTLESPLAAVEDLLMPSGSAFYLYIEVYPSTPQGQGNLLTTFELVPKESFVQLPVQELPPDLLQVSSPFQLSPVGDREGYVNGGESRLFNVSLLNQAETTERATLAANVSLPGWTVEVLPGSTYELGSGDAITLGIRVHAPADAREGDKAEIALNVTDGKGTSRILLLALTSVSIDVPDDGGVYIADEDANDKVVKQAKKSSPGAGVAGLFTALAVGVAIRRRRA